MDSKVNICLRTRWKLHRTKMHGKFGSFFSSLSGSDDKNAFEEL